MKKLYEDLYQTTLFQSGNLRTYAYYLKGETKNVLIYNTANKSDLEEIKKLGGIDYQCLSHRHESNQSLSYIKSEFQNILCVDEDESKIVSQTQNVDKVFKDDTKIDIGNDLEVILTPGHTSGGVCYYYKSEISKLNYLFTGDTFILWDGVLRTLPLGREGGSRELLLKSLEKLEKLEPNVIICSGLVGETSYIEVDVYEWKRIIKNSIEKLKG